MIFVDGQHEEMKIFMKVNSFLNRNMVPQNLFRACVQQVFYLSSCYAHTTPLFVFNKGWNVIFMRSMRFCELTFSNNNTSNNCQATSLTVLPLLLQNTAEIHLVAHYVDDVHTLGLIFCSFFLGLTLKLMGERGEIAVEVVTILHGTIKYVINLMLRYSGTV